MCRTASLTSTADLGRNALALAVVEAIGSSIGPRERISVLSIGATRAYRTSLAEADLARRLLLWEPASRDRLHEGAVLLRIATAHAWWDRRDTCRIKPRLGNRHVSLDGIEEPCLS